MIKNLTVEELKAVLQDNTDADHIVEYNINPVCTPSDDPRDVISMIIALYAILEFLNRNEGELDERCITGRGHLNNIIAYTLHQLEDKLNTDRKN
tara:strand:+ start:328 stop:612 length:285 start_codon:yes stop_codon:yes gene_type:complete